MTRSFRSSTAAALFLILLFLSIPPRSLAGPVRFGDADHRPIAITRRLERAVSLVPAITEIIFAVGAGDAVAGVTYHDTYPPEASLKPMAGGFFAPSIERIGTLDPDVIFVSDLHRNVITAFADRPGRVVRLRLDSLVDLFQTIRLIGQIFQADDRAASLSADISEALSHTARKTALIPPTEKKRVIRLMGRDTVMVPGDDSFQNEMIRAADGIPPSLGKTGKVVPITLAEWTAFNPQVVYGCGDDRKTAENMLNRPGWKDVDAVKNGRILYFPCELTCRLSSRTGYFVSCLSSRIYEDQYVNAAQVFPDGPERLRPVAVDLPWVASAEIRDSRLYDYVHKTLLVHFKSPMAVTSTLEGFRKNIRTVGNSYSPPQSWERYHTMGLAASRKRLLAVIEQNAGDTSLLFTGADMDHLSVQRKSFKEMTVVALVTAGVKSNAVRMSKDTGAYYEPGTINIILMSNMRLSPRAMNRAVITATEAKTAALWDMDIRSSQTPLVHPATGTGTDEIIVVEGNGPPIDNTGGHAKMGELMADAVYAGVREAVFKQNGIPPKQNVFQRLADRHISAFELAGVCDCGMKKTEMGRALERLLLVDRYAGFMETAFAVSDQYENGLISDLSAFQAWCDRISEEIAGAPVGSIPAIKPSEPLPRVLEMAFGALLKGLAAEKKKKRP